METTPPSESQLSFLIETKTEIVADVVPAVDWRSQVPSVSQLTRRIRGHLENSFFDVWVKGEVSNWKKPVSGHGYFSLKDATSQLRAVMFRPALGKLKFNLQDGMEILLHGKLTVYEARGDYQIVCDTAEPVGVGALQLAFEQLKLKLSKEGLFDPKNKQRPPFLPRRIGIVTSATGAAVRDILKVLSRRYPDRRLFLLPTSVQGEKAAGEIVAAIDLAEEWNERRPLEKIDVLIVGRGGGSLEDLWPFNEEIVARRIFKSRIPIISAVGHEIDFTIADFVADVRAPTPSAAAEIVVPKKSELTYMVRAQGARARTAMEKRLEQMRLHLGHLTQRLVDPRQKIRMMRENFRNLEQRLISAMRARVLLARHRVERGAEMLHTLSPLQAVARGYSITRRPDGVILRSCKEVSEGDRIHSWLGDGTIVSVVTKEMDKPFPLP